MPSGQPDADDAMAALIADFHDAYEREYTYRLDAPVEIVGIHLVASAEVGKLEMRKLAGDRRHARAAAIKGRRQVDYAHRGRPRSRRSTTARGSSRA